MGEFGGRKLNGGNVVIILQFRKAKEIIIKAVYRPNLLTPMSSRWILYSGLQTMWVALPTTYVAYNNTDFVLGVDQFHITGVGLLCGCPMFRAFSVSWILHCNWGITFTRGLSEEDPNLPQSSNSRLLSVTTLCLQYHMDGCYISDSAASSRCSFVFLGQSCISFCMMTLRRQSQLSQWNTRISLQWYWSLWQV